MQYTKPPLNLEAQADLLISRGMVGDKALMVDRLGVVSYYRLSGYWFPFRNADDSFKPGTCFDEVWNRYVFDRRFRLLVMDAIERIEITLRTQLSYHHSHAHGPFAYATDQTSLPKPNNEHYTAFLDSVKEETAKSKEHFVKHFQDKYGDCHEFLPIWIATEAMNFGTVLTLYNGCSNQVKNAVASCFGMPAKVLSSWLLTINAVRNICAHHSRLWNKVLGVKPAIPKRKNYPDWHIPATVPNDRVFAVLTFCRHALKRIAPQSNWHERLRALLAEYPSIPLAEMGFPADWESSPIWSSDAANSKQRPEAPGCLPAWLASLWR